VGSLNLESLGNEALKIKSGGAVEILNGVETFNGNEKRKAERHFNDQAIKEAIKRMTPELEAASEAAHKMKDSEDSGDDQDYRDFDRP